MYKCLSLSLLSLSLFATPLTESLNETSMTMFYLYGQVGYNRMYSPFAVNSALLALYCGAEGESAENLSSLYSLKIPQEMIPTVYNELYHPLERSIFFINSFWIHKDTPIRTKYQNLLSRYFNTSITGVNTLNPPQVTRNINTFALKKLPSQMQPFVNVGASFSLLSVNAMSYSLKWQNPFLTKYSTHKVFYPKSGENPTTTRMMSQLGRFHYYEDDSFQVVAIPLEKKELNHRLQFLVYLPKPHISDEPFEYAYNKLTHCLKIPSLLKPADLEIHLPSFEFQMNASLASTFSSLPIQNELTPEANFSLISGKSRLYLSDMISSTYLSVNEFGIGVIAGSDEESLEAMLHIESKKRSTLFNANRPFMYMIYDPENELILTLGVYASPMIKAPSPPPPIKQKIVPPPKAPNPPPANQPEPAPQPYPKREGSPNPDDDLSKDS